MNDAVVGVMTASEFTLGRLCSIRLCVGTTSGSLWFLPDPFPVSFSTQEQQKGAQSKEFSVKKIEEVF